MEILRVNKGAAENVNYREPQRELTASLFFFPSSHCCIPEEALEEKTRCLCIVQFNFCDYIYIYIQILNQIDSLGK